MCNLYERHYRSWAEYAALVAEEGDDWRIDPEIDPDPPTGQVKPTDPCPVILPAGNGLTVKVLRWGWQGPRGPVINVRSENRRDPVPSRGIVIPDAFYEYTGTKAPKSQWKFTPAGNEPLAFAVVTQADRFSLITCEPGEDVAPIHGRQPVLLERSTWRRWLSDPAWPADLARPSPAGSLRVEQTR